MIIGQKIGPTSRKLGKKSFNLLKKGVKLTGAIALGYGMAKVHSGITNDGDPEVVLKPQKEPIEDVFSSTLGSGGFEERGRSRRQAVSSIQPLEEESVVGDTNRGDGFPVMRFRE
tara:strand:+ start:983 stop:1327 length:345 start_codon:yes stop_codon:yes gene_type:complete